MLGVVSVTTHRILTIWLWSVVRAFRWIRHGALLPCSTRKLLRSIYSLGLQLFQAKVANGQITADFMRHIEQINDLASWNRLVLSSYLYNDLDLEPITTLHLFQTWRLLFLYFAKTEITNHDSTCDFEPITTLHLFQLSMMIIVSAPCRHRNHESRFDLRFWTNHHFAQDLFQLDMIITVFSILQTQKSRITIRLAILNQSRSRFTITIPYQQSRFEDQSRFKIVPVTNHDHDRLKSLINIPNAHVI